MQTFVAKFAVVLAAFSVGAFLRSTGLFNKQDARVMPHCLRHTKLDMNDARPCSCTAMSSEVHATLERVYITGATLHCRQHNLH